MHHCVCLSEAHKKRRLPFEKSLEGVAPEIASQWHPTRNGTITPRDVYSRSHQKVWWKCPEGPDHEWEATPHNRLRGGKGCPCCCGRQVSVTNSLATVAPEIAAQWHPTLNGTTTANGVVSQSNQKVWWKCPEGPDHKWEATPASRVGGGNGCPCCCGRQVSVTNSLATVAPEIAAQWHPTLNGTATPNDVVSQSHQKIWWKCPEGPDHEWEATPASRVGGGNGCPCCCGHQVSVTNSLATVAPEIAAQWHPTLNGTTTPNDVVSQSGQKVWWKCPEGPDHEWEARPADRVGGGKGCPCCCGRQVSVTNSLATVAPEIAAQWHPTLNGTTTANDVVSQSNQKVWWKCPEGPDHEWEARPADRVGGGSGCPCCCGRQVSVTNSLATVAPEIAAQWHPTLNGTTTPNDVVSQSNQKVWWKCPEGPDHEWEARPADRVGGGNGCPCCSGHQVSVTNSLATVAPEIAAQWHPTLNGTTTPNDVVSQSGQKVWWQCPHGHEWEASLDNRVGKLTGCPYCQNSTEDLVRQVLENLVGFPLPICCPGWLVNPRTKRRLELDMYSEVHRLAFEYDGEQHHQYIPHFHRTRDHFVYRCQLDRLKDEACHRHGVRLIRIPSHRLQGNTKDADAVRDVLQRILCEHDLCTLWKGTGLS